MTPELSREYLHHIGIVRLLIACSAVTLLSAKSEAQHLYDFLSGGEAKARLELSRLPATADDVVGLTFTPRGEEQFGLGPTYLGKIGGVATIIALDSGVLAGEDFENTVRWGGSVAPYESVPPNGLAPRFFILEFNDEWWVGGPTPGNSSIILQDISGETVYDLGYWRRVPVPEPSTVLLLLPAALVVFGVRRRMNLK